MSHPHDCNCMECAGVDPFAAKRLQRITDRLVASLTDKERAVLEKRFEDEPKTLQRIRRRKKTDA